MGWQRFEIRIDCNWQVGGCGGRGTVEAGVAVRAGADGTVEMSGFAGQCRKCGQIMKAAVRDVTSEMKARHAAELEAATPKDEYEEEALRLYLEEGDREERAAARKADEYWIHEEDMYYCPRWERDDL